MTFWTRIARFILKNRYLVLVCIALVTIFLVNQTDNIRFSNTEANLLPKDHPANIEYDQFIEIFGEEGNFIILGVKDSTFFNPKKFNAWNKLVKSFDKYPEIEFSISISDIKELKADRQKRKFVVENLFEGEPTTKEEVEKIKTQLFEKLPFYENLLYTNS